MHPTLRRPPGTTWSACSPSVVPFQIQYCSSPTGARPFHFQGPPPTNPATSLGLPTLRWSRLPYPPLPALPRSPTNPLPTSAPTPYTTTSPVANEGPPSADPPHDQGHRAPTYLHALTPTNARASYTFGTAFHRTHATPPSVSMVLAGLRR